MLSDRLLTPKATALEADGDSVRLVSGGARRPVARIVKCFPRSSPDGFISFRDPGGVELGLLARASDLPEPSRSLLARLLREHYDVPAITRILSVSRGPGGMTWHTETSDGPVEFRTRSDNDISSGAFPKLVLTDPITRKRYEIPDFTALERASQAVIRRNLHLVAGRDGRGHGRRR